MSGHYTQDEWEEYARQNMPRATMRQMEDFRDANNIFVDGMHPPKYTGPLSTGGYAGTPPQAQGPTPVEEDETDAVPQAGPLSVVNPNAWSGDMRALTNEQMAWGAEADSQRKQQYDKARQALLERRWGPSPAEQLFALSAAIGKPMIRPSFGGVLNNVTSSMADMEKATREAQASRADALAQLEQSMMSGNQNAKLAEFKARREALQAQAPIVAAQLRASAPKYAPVGDRFQQVPGTGDNLGILTPAQLLIAKSDPRNKGKSFYTQDGRPGVIN